MLSLVELQIQDAAERSPLFGKLINSNRGVLSAAPATNKKYKELVVDLLNVHRTVGCSVSVKIHFLFCIPFWTQNLGAVGDERGEIFHQGFSTMEERYAGRWSQDMLADCCWNFMEGVSIASYKRMIDRKKF